MACSQAPCTSSPQEGQNPKLKGWFLRNSISFLHICKAGKIVKLKCHQLGTICAAGENVKPHSFLAEAGNTFEGLYKLMQTLRGQSSAAKK